MNWYKIAQLANVEEREYPVAAIVIADGRQFEGRNHGEATKKAIDAGYASINEDGYLVDRSGKDMSFDGSTDLFRTNKGRIINRFEAFRLGEATGSEKIPEAEIDTLDKIVKNHKAKGLDIYVYENNNGSIFLSELRANKDARGQGLGTAFMQDLCGYADRTGKMIELNLGDKEAGGTTSKGRLIEFYKRFGFVRNFGRTKNYALSCQMYRKPK